MTHDEVERNFYLFAEGLLEERYASSMREHLTICKRCQTALMETETVLHDCDILSEVEGEPSSAFATEVMKTICAEATSSRVRSAGIFLFGSFRNGRLPRPILAFASLLLFTICLFVVPDVFRAHRLEKNTQVREYSNEASGSFSQAQFDDSLLRSSTGNVFKFIVGAPGAWGILLCLGFTGYFLVNYLRNRTNRRALKFSAIAGAFAIFLFFLRTLILIFFGSAGY